jgi:hypothetical protein
MANPIVYTFEGHGCEIPVPYEERFTLPPNVTMVTFTTCARIVDMKNSAWIFEPALSNDETVQNYFKDPANNIEQIERITKRRVRVYTPGSKIPELFFMPYSNFSLNNFVRDREMDGELVSLSGIIPLFEMKTTNEKWKNLHDEPAENAGLDSDGWWCYTNTPEKDEDSGEIEPEDIVLALPGSQFSESVEEEKIEYIPYTDLLYGDDYRDATLGDKKIPDDLYDYIYRHSVFRPPRTTEDIRNLSISMKGLIQNIKNPVVIYWNICRASCAGVTKEQKKLIPFIRGKSTERQQKIRYGAVPTEFDPAEAYLKLGGKRRKTFRKNLRKSRKLPKKWTQTRRSRSRQL